jgi:chromate transport protein ChrA
MPQADTSADRELAATAWKTWLAIGATGFGGPAGQVAILHREVVERKRWLTEEEFLAALRVCMLLPGPEAQQLATYAGWRTGGTWGGLLAGTLFVVPGAVLVTALAWLHAAGRDVPLVAAAFAGVRPAVVALVGLAAWRIGRRSIRSPAGAALAIAAAAALAWGLPFPAVVAICGVCGWLAPAARDPAAAPPEANHPARRGLARHAAAVAGLEGAATATAFAFIPSFAMILALAPAVRSIHAGSRLGRALAAVGAAVVAAIALLAIRLAQDAFLPAGRLHAIAVVIAALAAVALAGAKAPTPLVVLATAALGVLRAAL